ncbi:Suclg2 protein [Oopsacas minuta]|uniref:Succinate--CoA ligase [GDP-forming] subunit beta, mitochondrial n=1 Tax=Oopsacas minuta TaxID=111878 RepID=A0AAV7JZ62_9METZ|nr:Suclg2 protein [Oopsacas minuta]
MSLFKFLLSAQRTIQSSRLNTLLTQTRCLSLHEYQSKELMQSFGINTQPFGIASTAKEALEAARSLNVTEYVVKSQILAGGRGKGKFDNGLVGGVKLVNSLDDVERLAGQMLGAKLVTKQTPPDGVTVNKVMIARALDITEERYLAILLDRAAGGPVIVASTDGGVDIEEVAANLPERIFKYPIDIDQGLNDDTSVEIAKSLGFKGEAVHITAKQIRQLYKMFTSVDATQIEINPLGLTREGEVVCFDAKINFDDNAKFRQGKIFEMQDHSETDPRELAAQESNLSYVGMSGNIGCLVNGAGLAMATMDIIKLYNGEPANFLDCGGGVQESQVQAAFQIITQDPQVNAILVNIFGGIVDCRIIANGIVAACKKLELKVPIVARLEGNNGDKAKKILEDSGLNIISADDMAMAAEKVTSFVK